jgi:hypothetical protein
MVISEKKSLLLQWQYTVMLEGNPSWNHKFSRFYCERRYGPLQDHKVSRFYCERCYGPLQDRKFSRFYCEQCYGPLQDPKFSRFHCYFLCFSLYVCE